MYERVLLSLDGTPEAESALPVLEELLRTQAKPATVVLVCVGPPVNLESTVDEMKQGTNFSPTSRVPVEPGDEDELLMDAKERELRAYLNQVSKRLQQLDTTIITEVSLCNPAADIQYFSRYYNVDLIVMATHGRRGLNRLLHGSVTEAVMENTACPMLVVHVKTRDHAIQRRGLHSRPIIGFVSRIAHTTNRDLRTAQPSDQFAHLHHR